jgi:hypothetical protein
VGTGSNWVLSHTALQRESPDEVIGRLSAFDELLVTVAMVLGAFAGATAVMLSGIGAAAIVGAVLGALGIAAAAAIVAAAPRGSVDQRQVTEQVVLPHVHPVVAQDVVRGGDVKVEVGEDEVVEVVAAP